MKTIRVYIIHIALALFISSTAMPMFFRGRSNIFPITCGLTVAVILLFSFMKTLRNITISQIFFLAILGVSFILSSVNVTDPSSLAVLLNYFQFFLICGVGSLAIVNGDYNYEIFLRSLIVIALTIAPVVLATDYSGMGYVLDNDEWMGQIYAITPYLVASINYLFVGRKKIFKILSVVVLNLYFSMVVMHTPRGAVVTLLMSIIIFIIQKTVEKGIKLRRVFVFGLGLFLVILLSSGLIIGQLQYLSDEYGLRWLAKFVYEEDISNNRYPLYQEAWDGFVNSPLWGNGIAHFHNFEAYPHNLFLQMMYETGILLVIPISFLLFEALKIMLKLKSEYGYNYQFITFFFLLSFNQLMFSSFFWRNQAFWMVIWMMVAIITLRYRQKKY